MSKERGQVESDRPRRRCRVGAIYRAARYFLIETQKALASSPFSPSPIDRARIRTIVTAAHTDEMLDTALGAFQRVGRELGVIAG